MAQKKNKIIYEIEINDKGNIKIDNVTKGFERASGAVKKLNQDLITQGNIMEDNSKKNQKMIDKTGLAGATLVELGRTVSDSNYGLRGMANNISQLATLMTTLLFTTGSFRGGLMALGKAMFGPLGIIVLFQGVIAMLEGQAIAAQGAKKEINALAEAIAKAGSDLKTFLSLVDRGNLSQEEMVDTVAQLNDNYKDLNIQLDDEGQLTKESRDQIDKKILAIKRLAKAQALQVQLEKLYIEELQAISGRQKDIDTVDDENFLQQAGRIFMGEVEKVKALFTGEVMTQSIFLVKNRERRLKNIEEEFDEAQKLRNKNILNILNMLEEEGLADEAFGDKKGKDEKARLTRLDNLRKKYIEGAKIDDRLHKDEQLEQQKQLVLKQAETDRASKEILFAIEEDFNQKIENAREARREKEAQARQRDILKSIRYANELIKIEQNRLKAEQNIQTQRVGFAEQVAGILTSIAREGSTLAKVGLVLEKGAAIADIIIKSQQSIATQTAATQAANMQVTAAYASIPFFGPTIAGRQIALNQAMLAKGIAATKLSAGLSVAGILATSLTSTGAGIQGSAPASGTSSSAPQIQAPAFNVVGATQESQLAQAISGQDDKPLKAFVVASDISTAQELERSTIEGASIG
jgi:hypothetical protein